MKIQTTSAPPPSLGSMNKVAVGLAVVIAIVLMPAILRFQEKRFEEPPIVKRSWRMRELVGTTQDDLITRFGPPLSTKDYSLSVGSFAGPDIGLKHYYLVRAPDYGKRLKTAEATWAFPQYMDIREMIWKLPDSYLTVWLHEPRAEVSLQGDSLDLTLPRTAPGAWVALDDYRIGQDLIAAQPK